MREGKIPALLLASRAIECGKWAREDGDFGARVSGDFGGLGMSGGLGHRLLGYQTGA